METVRIDLHLPTSWQELTTDQLRLVVETATKGLRREEVLLVLLCKFAGIKMVSGTYKENGRRFVSTGFVTADGKPFHLDAGQVSDFCGRLGFVYDTPLPIDVAWPFKWNRYLMGTSFGDWFHADALILKFSMTGDIISLQCAMSDLGDPHPDLQAESADFILMLKWHECFKEWLQERYPLVFQKSDTADGTGYNPVDARQNIMLMLNEGRPQDNEAIEKTNMHDVLAALQHKIETAKQAEQQLKNIR